MDTDTDVDMGSFKIHFYILTKVFFIPNVLLQQYLLSNPGSYLSIVIIHFISARVKNRLAHYRMPWTAYSIVKMLWKYNSESCTLSWRVSM